MRPAPGPDPETVACELCGHRFDPRVRSGCGACPLGSGCHLACCPACGYASIDPERSWAARLVSSLAHRRRPRHPVGGATLADLPRGTRASVQSLDALPAGSRERLYAYGLTPGRAIEVVQSAPVTIVRIGYLELAFESELAGGIQVIA